MIVVLRPSKNVCGTQKVKGQKRIVDGGDGPYGKMG